MWINILAVIAILYVTTSIVVSYKEAERETQAEKQRNKRQ